MADDLVNPQEELAKLERVIRQYEGVVRTTVDPAQQARVFEKLKALRMYRDKLQRTFEASGGPEAAEAEAEPPDPLEKYSYLALARSLCGPADEGSDRETAALTTYLRCFAAEYLVLLSQRQLKLDFKYSLERDGFYGRYRDLQRKLDDLRQELLKNERGEHRPELREEAHKRAFKMHRSVAVETHRFFKAIVAFASDLIEDIETDGFKCLNGTATVRFEPVEGKRHLEGVRVVDALKQMRGYAAEVIEFLNLPEFEAQE
jgi:hypothetical protein